MAFIRFSKSISKYTTARAQKGESTTVTFWNNTPHKQQCGVQSGSEIQRGVRPLFKAQCRLCSNTLSHQLNTTTVISLMIFNRDKWAGMLHITSTDSELLSRPRDIKPMWAEFRARPPFIIAGARRCCVAYTRSGSRKTALARTAPLALVMYAQMYALPLLWRGVSYPLPPPKLP